MEGVEFIRALWSEIKEEKRTKWGILRIYDRKRTETDWFVSLDYLASKLKEFKASGADIYFSVGKFSEDAKRMLEKNVRIIPAFWVDCDFKGEKPSLGSFLDGISQVPFSPSIIVDSGGGYHVYWKFDRNFYLDNRRAYYARRILKALAILTGGDHVQNLNRVLRLPGTLNYKYKPPRECWVRYREDVAYNPWDFGALLRVTAKIDLGSFEKYSEGIEEFRNMSWMEAIMAIESLRKIWEGEDPPPNDLTRSGWDMKLVTRMVLCPYRKFTDEEIMEALRVFPYGKNSDATLAYMKHTIKKARMTKIEEIWK